MPPSVEIKGHHNIASLISEQAIQDMVELFYRGKSKKIVVYGCRDVAEMRKVHSDKTIRDRLRGEHRFFPIQDKHVITLVRSNITASGDLEHFGGNLPAPNKLMRAPMVFAHELQHANQSHEHSQDDLEFWGKPYSKYVTRGCEKDARRFVDEKMAEICAYFAVDPPRPREKGPILDHGQEVRTIAEVLSECSEVTLEDIKDELRMSGVLNPGNVMKVVQLLKEGGFQI